MFFINQTSISRYRPLQMSAQNQTEQISPHTPRQPLSHGHNDANKATNISSRSEFDKMPSLVRFLVVVGTLTAAVAGGLYVLATQFEPAQQEVTKPVPNVKIRKP
jgi:hypothetical protein